MKAIINNRKGYAIWNVLFGFLLVAYVLAFFSESSRALYPAYAAGAAIVLFACLNAKWEDQVWRVTCGFLVLTGIFFFANRVYHGVPSFNLATIVINVVAGFLLYRKSINKQWVLLLFSAIAGFFIYKIGIQGVGPSQIFPEHSRNHVSNVMIGVTALWYIAEIRKGKPVSLIPAAVCFAVCVMAFGRSGVLSSGILLVGVFINQMLVLPNASERKLLTGLGGVALIVVAMVYSREIMEWINPLMVRFEVQGLRSISRVWIMEDYVSQINLLTAIIGMPQRFTHFATGFSAHISYLQWHMSMGLMAIVLLAAAGYSLWKLFFIERFYAVVLLAIMTRAATDHVMLTSGFFYGPVLCFAIYTAIWGYPHIDYNIAPASKGRMRRRMARPERMVAMQREPRQRYIGRKGN